MAYAMDYLRSLGVPVSAMAAWVMTISTRRERSVGRAQCITREICNYVCFAVRLCQRTAGAPRQSAVSCGVRAQFRKALTPAAPTAPARRLPSAENMVGVPVTFRR